MNKVGTNIRKERKNLKISQNELAKILDVSRPAVGAIEKGTRKVTAEELIKLSKAFSVSVDQLLGLSIKSKVVLEKSVKKKRDVQKERINVPQRNIRKFKEVFLYILREVGMRPNVGETVIYKLMYFIDFDYYEKYEEQLIGARYIKNTYGPTPMEFQEIVKEMINENEIEKINVNYHGFTQKKYIPKRDPNLEELTAREMELITDVLDRLAHKSAKQLTDYSHNDIPYMTTGDNEIIEYETVFYRTIQYSVRDYEEEKEVS